MNFIKKIFLIFIIFNIPSAFAKSAPDSFADLAEKLMPSVVNISTTQTVKTNFNNNPFPFKFPPGSPFGEMFKDFENQQPTERKASALGSGFIIKEDGIVITNNHVIANAEDILVRVGDKEYKANLVGADPYMDIAVLKMETKDKFKPVKFGDSDLARVGDWAMAIGNPFGLGGTVTAGIISARNRDINLTRYDDFIQTDASINQGNSGGPLFNLKGDVIGINTAILGQSGSIGIGFAIPANAASSVIDQLIEFGETRPENKTGVKAGDIILEKKKKKIDTMRKLPKVVANTKVGKSVQLKIWRNKKLITKKLTLGRLESSEEFKEKKTKTVQKKEETIKSLKITVRETTKEDISSRNLNTNTKGVVITNIQNKSPLANVLSVNDIIIEVQKNSIKNSSDLKKIVDGIFKKGEKTLLLTVINQNNRRRYLGVKIN